MYNHVQYVVSTIPFFFTATHALCVLSKDLWLRFTSAFKTETEELTIHTQTLPLMKYFQVLPQHELLFGVDKRAKQHMFTSCACVCSGRRGATNAGFKLYADLLLVRIRTNFFLVIISAFTVCIIGQR